MANNLNNKYMLQRYRKDLEAVLKYDDLKDKLFAKSVLNDGDLSSIDVLDSNSLKVETCLNLLLEKNDHLALHNFINSLNEVNLQIYNDMYDKLTDPKGLKEMKQEEGAKAIQIGGVPRKCNSYVSRKEEKELEHLLSNQEVNGVIVLRGFPMVGKTTLASHVLREYPELVFDHFRNKVFWLDLRDVKENDLAAIADWLKRTIGRITNFELSIDMQRENTLAWYTDLLRAKFLSLCNGGILILDNVCSLGLIKHFDIGCKMLIIVNGECEIENTSKQIKLGGFTQGETTACFVTALSIDGSNLSEKIPIIKKIHQCLEGHPKLVTLLAAYLTNRQAGKWTKQRWEDMLHRLQMDGDVAGRGDSQFEVLQKPLKQITNMLLELLSEEQQNYFKQLAIMPEQVNISPEVLSVYWNIPDYDVEDILNRFHELLLLERTMITIENKEDTFIYGLRNMFTKYLKSTLPAEFVETCHRNLLKAYRAKYDDLAKLPNDNYIYNYYGHHLMGANQLEGFEVFLCLRFIGAKIKYCGVGEVLQDFRLYETYITKNNTPELTKKLNAYAHFVETCETNLLKNGLDLVQYALRVTDNHQIVFNDAFEIARNSKKLYLTWAFKNEPHFTRTLDVHNQFETILFANDPKLILVGTKTGDIQLWNLDSRLMLLKYVGHTKGIKSMKLSRCKKFFVSTSHDSTFKIWKLNSKHATHTVEEPLSPSLRQRDHHSFFSDEKSVSAVCDSAVVSGAITTTSATFYNKMNASETDKTLHLITCPNGGELMLWSFQEADLIFPLKLLGQLLVGKVRSFDIVASGQMFLFVYSQAKQKLCVVDPQLNDGSNYIAIISLADGNSEDPQIRQILAVNDEVCVAIGKKIQVLRFEYKKQQPTYEKYELPLQRSILSCASLTADGAYLVTGTEDGYILLWNLKLLRVVKEFAINNRLVIGLDTYSTPDSITLLLSGSDDSTVKCWHIASDHLSQQYDALNNTTSDRRSTSSVMCQQVPQRQMFSCYWPDNYNQSSAFAIVAVLDEDNNAIQIHHVSKLRTDRLICTVDLPPPVAFDCDDSDVTVFALDDDALYYALRSGAVRRYHLHTNSDELLWNCNTLESRERQVASIMCLGDNSVLIGCNRNSLTLVQCTLALDPIITVLLDPSTRDDDIVRIFQLHLNVRVRMRIKRLLVAYSSDVYVLCAEHTSVASSLKPFTVAWSTSLYRMKTGQTGNYAGVRITDCILSSAESHLVLFLSDGKCDILRLEQTDSGLSYQSEYVFQLDPEVRVTATAISFDGRLLALGKQNGDIEIIDIADKTTKIVLKEHKLKIETLLFSSKPDNVLVSAAESICWWKFEEISNTLLEDKAQMIENQVWRNKKPDSTPVTAVDQSSKYLLSRIPLSGPLKHVTASKDFTSFITLDSLGIIHSFSVIA